MKRLKMLGISLCLFERLSSRHKPHASMTVGVSPVASFEQLWLQEMLPFRQRLFRHSQPLPATEYMYIIFNRYIIRSHDALSEHVLVFI